MDKPTKTTNLPNTTRARSVIGTLALGLLLCSTACAGGTPKAALNCAVPSAPTMIYPANNATGVSDRNFTLLLAFTSNPSNWTVPSIEGGGSFLATSPAPLPSPLPTPNSGVPTGATLQAVSVGVLQAATQYNVVVSYQFPTGCLPPGAGTPALTVVGSFTTH